MLLVIFNRHFCSLSRVYSASIFLRAGMVRNSQSTMKVQTEENKKVSKD